MALAKTDLHGINIPLEWSVGLEVINQILGGLVHLHDKGIVHHDVKPGNILVFHETGKGYVFKLTDLDVAKK